MIKVIVKDNIIKVSGHAKFDDYGKDIVCASVSSIIYTTVNGILNINRDAIEVIDNNDFIITVKNNTLVTQKLIETMMELLKDLEKQYPKNINVKEN